MKGMNGKKAAKILVEKGLLIPGESGKNARSIDILGYGKRVRLYHVTSHISSYEE